MWPNVRATTFVLGDFNVQWKILEISALQESSSEKFRLKSMYTVMFRADFGYD